jgi:DNA-binding MarR family transcriptional regulator
MYSKRSLPVLVWLRLLRVARKIGHAGSQHIEACGLSDGLFDVLSRIADDEGLTQQELADKLLVTKGNVSQLLAKLEQKGLVEKRPAGRVKHIYLTAAGRELLADIIPRHDAFVVEHMGRLNEEELRQLNDLLRKLDKRLD